MRLAPHVNPRSQLKLPHYVLTESSPLKSSSSCGRAVATPIPASASTIKEDGLASTLTHTPRRSALDSSANVEPTQKIVSGVMTPTKASCAPPRPLKAARRNNHQAQHDFTSKALPKLPDSEVFLDVPTGPSFFDAFADYDVFRASVDMTLASCRPDSMLLDPDLSHSRSVLDETEEADYQYGLPSHAFVDLPDSSSSSASSFLSDLSGPSKPTDRSSDSTRDNPRPCIHTVPSPVAANIDISIQISSIDETGSAQIQSSTSSSACSPGTSKVKAPIPLKSKHRDGLSSDSRLSKSDDTAPIEANTVWRISTGLVCDSLSPLSTPASSPRSARQALSPMGSPKFEGLESKYELWKPDPSAAPKPKPFDLGESGTVTQISMKRSTNLRNLRKQAYPPRVNYAIRQASLPSSLARKTSSTPLVTPSTRQRDTSGSSSYFSADEDFGNTVSEQGQDWTSMLG